MNLKKLNVGLVALVLGFGLVVTQSAFKSSKADMYGKVISGASHSWEPLAGLTEYTGSVSNPLPDNTYRCLLEPTETCTAEFAIPPVGDEEEISASSNGNFEFKR